MMRFRVRRAWLGLLTLAALGCSAKQSDDPKPIESAPAKPAENRGARAAEPNDRFDFVDQLGGCEVEHEGLLIDLGSPEPQSWSSFEPRPSNPESIVEREGATFERIRTREVSYGFWLDETRPKLGVSVRVYGGAAKWLHVVIDDKRVGAIKLAAGETKIVALPPLGAEIARGRHRLFFRLSGAPRGTKEPLAEIDWVKLGETSETPANYAAPTLRSIQSDVVLDGAPKRSIVLRAPGSVRCWVRPAPDARLRVGLGFWGQGKGVAEIRIVADGEPPAVLQTRKLAGGDAATWSPVALDLTPWSTKPVGIEFRALEATRGGRVAFGDPMLTRKNAEIPQISATKTVVLIVGAGLDRRRIPPWGPNVGQGALAELARVGAAFSLHRATTTVPQGALASMLTGLMPHEHSVQSPNERLPAAVRTVAEIVKEAGGRTAFFTGVPTSFAPFGFHEGWDVFDALSPVSDLPATEPYLRAARWLEQELDADGQTIRFVLLHVRGGHPPWDIGREEAQKLKPEEYSGVLDARRGGILLGALRIKQQKRQRTRLHDDDWVRLRSLQDAALAKQDVGLTRIFEVLKKKGAWESSLILFAGDVAPGDPPDLPFDPAGPLMEDRLLVPLLVKFPNLVLAGKEINQPTSSLDIASTVLAALRLGQASTDAGADLFARASGRLPLAGAPQLATLKTRFATRFGPWLLRGELKKVPLLCALEVDPACVNDVFSERPFAARSLWDLTYRAEVRALGSKLRPAAEAAVFDADTLAALTVWGDIQ